MISIDYIKEYLVLAETLNFSKAAEATYITQPSLSRHISMIEDDIGARLFERTSRSVELTPAGEMVREQFEAILQRYEYAKAHARALESGEEGTLVVASPYQWIEDYVEPVASAFEERFPSCEVEIRSIELPDSLQSMVDGNADLALNMGNVDEGSGILREPFVQERFAVTMTVEHPLAGRDSICLEELRPDEHYVVLAQLARSGNGDYQTFLLDLLGKRGIVPEHIQLVDQVQTIGTVISQTGGVCVAPYGFRHFDRSYLRTVLLEDDDCRFPIYLCYREDNPNPLLQPFLYIARRLGPSLELHG